jgi:hypothetical protein
VVSELVILPAYEGIQAWIWKTIKTMQGTMELVVQRGNKTRHKGQDEEFTDCLREYMALSEAFHTTMSFKDFCTIKHPEWYEPQVSVDKKVKVPRKRY